MSSTQLEVLMFFHLIRIKMGRLITACVCAAGLAALANVGLADPASVKNAQGHPDFTGVWKPTNEVRTEREFLPAAEKIFEKNHRGVLNGDPDSDPNFRCLPSGFPRMMLAPLPFWVMQTPTAIGLIGEAGDLPRVIYMNRKHVDGLWPQWMGDSTATWEGTTLVIDTVNFNEQTWLVKDGTPHSDALRVVERWRLMGPDEMEMKIIITDPKVFKKPWIVTNTEKRDMSARPGETGCQNPRVRP
jgi:hypothetical protein